MRLTLLIHPPGARPPADQAPEPRSRRQSGDDACLAGSIHRVEGAVHEPCWALDFVEEVQEAEEESEPPPTKARHISFCWQASNTRQRDPRRGAGRRGRGLGPAELADAEVYPLGWSEPGELDWARPWYDDLTQFFEAAAGANDAMLVWLD
ncbi:DUF1877 family protein [Streptomyces sp. NPDC093990]|uniref:DUF1877 family protein n=1 Tax=Streptomyces sp. NPDC093990 TaxID=3155306 RepID=UPI00343AA970